MNREVELLEFNIDDLDKMNVSYDKGLDPMEYRRKLEEVLTLGESRLIKYDGDYIAVMGYYQLWPGTCELWLLINDPIMYKGVLAWVLKDALNDMIGSNVFHRMQATIKVGDVGEPFIERMGFKVEGLLEKYDALKQDYNMWARVI